MGWIRPILRLTRSALAGRPERTRLLVLAVAAATALLTGIACALESINAGVEQGMTSVIGAADVRVKRVGEDRFDASVLESVTGAKGVRAAAPKVKGAAALRRAPRPGEDAGTFPVVQAMVTGIDPLREPVLGEVTVQRGGRSVQSPNEAVLDAPTAAELGVAIGDEVESIGPRPVRWRVVGLTAGLPMKSIKRPEAIVALESLWDVTGFPGRINEVRVALEKGVDPFAFASDLSAKLPTDLYAEPTAPITSGLKAKAQAGRLVYLLVSILGFVASSFIVLTGLTTDLLERQRDLAVMRCIGATRLQLGAAQVGVGAVIGLSGALLGVPVGVGFVMALIAVFPERFGAGFRVEAFALAIGLGGAVLAGIAGAVWPAVKAARSSPLGAVRSRAATVKPLWVFACLIVGLLGLAWQAASVFLIPDGQTSFWVYATTGLPAMFIGYFLLGVPVTLLVGRLASPLLAGVLRLPAAMLGRFTAQHPFRNGFTAGALMVGLAMMTVIWTVGAAVFRDFLGGFRFPDAFVQSWNGLDEATRERIEALPGVRGTSAITMVRVDGGRSFGLERFGTRQTTFIAFEPERFFDLVDLRWEAGDPEYAKRRLKEGGAVIVAKEFLIAQRGYKVGDTFTLKHKGKDHAFEIVGAVNSPGLEVLNAFFDIGKQYAEQAMSAVFGSREDMRRVFGTDAIHLIQVSVAPGLDDAAITELLRSVAGPAATIGSGRGIKARIDELGKEGLLVASIVAVSAMLIACFGVGNIVAAGIDARRFEFGVLRAVGAGRGVLVRLVLAEAALIALAACVLGTLLGLQASTAGIRMHHVLFGIDTRFVVPVAALAAGWAALVALTLLAAWPMVRRLGATPTRALLAGRS